MDGSRPTTEYFVVLRVEGLYPHQLAGYEAHRMRKHGDLAHVDAGRSHLNRRLIGDADWAAKALSEIREMADEKYAAELAALEKRKRRKNIKRWMVEEPKQPLAPDAPRPDARGGPDGQPRVVRMRSGRFLRRGDKRARAGVPGTPRGVAARTFRRECHPCPRRPRRRGVSHSRRDHAPRNGRNRQAEGEDQDRHGDAADVAAVDLPAHQGLLLRQ